MPYCLTFIEGLKFQLRLHPTTLGQPAKFFSPLFRQIIKKFINSKIQWFQNLMVQNQSNFVLQSTNVCPYQKCQKFNVQHSNPISMLPTTNVPLKSPNFQNSNVPQYLQKCQKFQCVKNWPKSFKCFRLQYPSVIADQTLSSVPKFPFIQFQSSFLPTTNVPLKTTKNALKFQCFTYQFFRSSLNPSSPCPKLRDQLMRVPMFVYCVFPTWSSVFYRRPNLNDCT